MSYLALESADVAADELVSLLTTLRDAGEFNGLLTDLRADLGKDNDYSLLITKRDNPVAILNDSDESLYGHLLVSFLPGFEGLRSLRGKSNLDDTFQVGLSIETHVGGSRTATSLLRQFCRTLSDWMWWQDPTATIRRRRNLSAVDGAPTHEDIVALICPTTLAGSSVFLSLRKYHFEGVA